MEQISQLIRSGKDSPNLYVYSLYSETYCKNIPKTESKLATSLKRQSKENIEVNAYLNFPYLVLVSPTQNLEIHCLQVRNYIKPEKDTYPIAPIPKQIDPKKKNTKFHIQQSKPIEGSTCHQSLLESPTLEPFREHVPRSLGRCIS